MGRALKERRRLPGGEPLLVIHGAHDGPVLGVTATIHGDEFEGPLALFRFFEDVDPAVLTGSVVAMPVANPAAFAAVSRLHPGDSANLARVFPGDANGTVSQVLARVIETEVIARSDFFLDLHTGGVRYAMPSMAGYYTVDPRSCAAALAFGAPVIWGHPVIPPGRTLSSCLDREIPFLYTEGRGGGRLDAADTALFECGLWNLCAHLGMLPRRFDVAPPATHLFGDGNVDQSEDAPDGGFFVPEVDVLDPVSPGALIGRLLDLDGSPLAAIRARAGGLVGLIRLCPSVRRGEPLYLLAQSLTDGGGRATRAPVP